MIDPARVYASGFSSGSNMVLQFLLDAQSPFKGLAPIAGGLWSGNTFPSLADGPRIYMATGYRDYLWPYARSTLDQLPAAGLPADRVIIRHTGGGHDLYSWHFDELWQWLDEKTGFPQTDLASPWTAETLPSPADVNAFAQDGAYIVAAGQHGRVWRRGSGGWTLELDRGSGADFTALCFGPTTALVGGNYMAVERSTTGWGA